MVSICNETVSNYLRKVIQPESEKNMKMINTSECEKCEHGKVDDSNKARIIVHCNVKDKDYIYGACIPCEEKVKKNERT